MCVCVCVCVYVCMRGTHICFLILHGQIMFLHVAEFIVMKQRSRCNVYLDVQCLMGCLSILCLQPENYHRKLTIFGN